MIVNIGMLSNGEIISCCLDYEAEIGYGNLNTVDLNDPVLQERRNKIADNVLIEPLCRRCAGYVMFASREFIPGLEQEVTFNVADSTPSDEHESNATKEGAVKRNIAYVYARLNASHLEIATGTSNLSRDIHIRIFEYLKTQDTFVEEYSLASQIRKGKDGVLIPFEFAYGTFYRIEITYRPLEGDIVKMTLRSVNLRFTLSSFCKRSDRLFQKFSPYNKFARPVLEKMYQSIR